jgi:basic membrane protein A
MIRSSRIFFLEKEGDNMRKSTYWFLTLLMILAMALVACGGGGEEPAAESSGEETAADAGEEAAEEPAEEAPAEEEASDDCSSPDVFCIGLVTDVGEIDDKSFNQSAWEGAERAEAELGAKVDYIETGDAKDYEANIGLFAENNYDVIVTVGFALGEATAAAALEYPDIDFIGVDQFQVWQFDDDASNDIPNLVGLVFNEDKAGFLAGALAGMLTETNTIAAVLGTDLVPPVVAFKEGYENGALYTNPDVSFISTYHPGGLDVAFTDPEWGATTAKQAIDQGADIIFGAGGKTGNGALIEVASNEGTYCIGVDTDQWETVPEAHSCLVSSAMKLITPGVFDLAKMSMDGEFPATGNFFGAVGLADFHDFDSEISDEIKSTLAEIDAGLADGSISTGYGE